MKDQVSKSEYERLMTWQHRMVGLFLGAMVAIFAVLLSSLLFRFTPSIITYLFLGLIIIFVIPAILLQFSERCPRCGHRLGLQTRLILPEICKHCGVSFKRHP